MKIVSVKLPQPTAGIVNGRTLQVVLTCLAQKITSDLLDQTVTNFKIDRENRELQIHFEVSER